MADVAEIPPAPDASPVVPPPAVAPPDRACMAAFSAGWILAGLHRSVLDGDGATGPADELPSVNELGRTERIRFGLEQLDVLLLTLRAALYPRPGAPPVTTDAARHEPTSQGVLGDLHLALLEGLTLSRSQLGSSYVLGRWLSDLSGKPNTQDDFTKQYNKDRLSALQGVLRDVESAFPLHAAAAVSGGLAHWAAWLSLSTPRDWKDTKVGVAARAQGEHWRALLSGEKNPSSLLTPEAYVEAAEAALRRAGAITKRVLANFWIPVAVAMVATAAAVFVALHYSQGTAKVWTSVLTAAGGLGITAQGIKTMARRLATKAGGTLLNLAEDDAVAWAATWLPATASPGPVAGRTQSRQLRRMGVAPPSSLP